MDSRPLRLSRRGFLAGASLAWLADASAFARQLHAAPAQDYWDIVRDAFSIPADRIYLNVGTLGAQPRVVVDAVVEHTRRVAETLPPALDWDALKDALGRLLDADAAGFVFPRNTTEGMSFVANGLELRAGDEILTTDHEHIGGLCCWQLVAARHDLRLRQLPLPPPDAPPEAILEVFRNALTARTRVVSVSHVTFTHGRVLPVRALVELCRSRGIVSVVDGAHPPGLMPFSLREIGPDFYASSPHKWLLAPQGTGFLWMADEWRTRLWPTLASGGWDDLSLGAHRFNHLGTLDESRLAGLAAALRFHEDVGADRVADRVRTLRTRLFDGLAALPRVRLVTPRGPLAEGMVSFTVDGIPSLELQRRLARVTVNGREVRIRTRVIGEYDYGWMRLSPHIYNSEDDIDTVIAALGAA